MTRHFVDKVNFGPFLFEPKTGSLTKHGQKIRLQPKSGAALTALLEHAGEVVTREQMRNVLWPDGTHVDFDLGIKVAVKKLRDALSDSAEDPIYVQTVQGGYRFIGDVERVFAPNPTRAPTEPSAETEQAFPTPTPIDNQTLRSDQVRQPGAIDRPWVLRRPRTWIATALACIVLLAIGSASLGRRRVREPDQGRTAKIMLVVLPFENLSGDPGLEYLGDGITEELSEQLGNLAPQRLGVIGRTSAMVYKHSPRAISQIGKELGVSYILEGSVRRAGDKLRITAQLVEVSDQAHVWASDYDRKVRDLVQLEDEVAREITRQVGVSVARKSPEKMRRHIPDPEAHDAYLLGRYYWNKRTPAGYRAGAGYFRRAIEKDPQYAAAYAGLAESRIPTSEAKAAALKAVELDPSSGEAQTALGWVELFREVDVPAAERTLNTAIELDPNYASAHHWYAFVLEATGRVAESRTELARAAKLDPLSLIIQTAVASSLSEAGQHDAALAQLRLVFDMDPHYPKAHEELGRIYERKGMYRDAIHEYQLSAKNGGDPLWANLGYAYAVSGEKQEALSVLAHLEEMERRSQVSPCDLALVNIGLGRKEEAIAWLQKASLKPDDVWLSLQVDSRFDPLRSNPRFQALLRQMKLLS
jgi:TolB-like protein/DNA-binding winged helix-turn-helix (wHTH) protein/Flp pilus assembly protein TadD